MINEELYQRCLMAVAPQENKRLNRANNIDISPPLSDAPEERLVQEVTKVLARRKYATIYDIGKSMSVHSGTIRNIMNKLVRDGTVMSGQDASAKRTIDWMPKDDDGFVPMINRSPTTRRASAERPRKSERLAQVERERQQVLEHMTHGRWAHVNTIAAKVGIRVPIARGHLRRLAEMGLVQEQKKYNRTYWKIATTSTLAAE